jgi:hypothetical protein
LDLINALQRMSGRPIRCASAVIASVATLRRGPRVKATFLTLASCLKTLRKRGATDWLKWNPDFVEKTETLGKGFFPEKILDILEQVWYTI